MPYDKSAVECSPAVRLPLRAAPYLRGPYGPTSGSAEVLTMVADNNGSHTRCLALLPSIIDTSSNFKPNTRSESRRRVRVFRVLLAALAKGCSLRLSARDRPLLSLIPLLTRRADL